MCSCWVNLLKSQWLTDCWFQSVKQDRSSVYVASSGWVETSPAEPRLLPAEVILHHFLLEFWSSCCWPPAGCRSTHFPPSILADGTWTKLRPHSGPGWFDFCTAGGSGDVAAIFMYSLWYLLCYCPGLNYRRFQWFMLKDRKWTKMDRMS